MAAKSNQYDFGNQEVKAREFTGKLNGSTVNPSITGLTALAGGATLEQAVTKINQIIAALKA